jgi:hypothetical protein
MPARRRRSGKLGLVYFLLLSGLLLGGSLWLDRRGTPVAATVSAKGEEITVQRVPQGGWSRWYRVGVEFRTSDAGLGMATVSVPEDRFDALHPGDTLGIRYLPAFPLLARAADRSTMQVLADAAARFVAEPFLLPFLFWLSCGIVGLWLAARVATPVVIVTGLAWLAAGLVLLFPAPAPLPAAPERATARVQAVTLVTKAPAGQARRRRGGRRGSDAVRRLAMPYQVVQLRLAVPGRPDSVLAVDAVDSASVPGLAVGATLRVGYDPRRPREARLTQGTRAFREQNRYHFLIPVLGVGVLGVLGAWGWRVRRRKASQRPPTKSPAEGWA